METNDPQSALTQLRAYLAQHQDGSDSRLPPERELCKRLGVSRSALRKSLATLESEGHLWRRVGKGTFVGSRPVEDFIDIKRITSQTNPVEVMRTRQIFEPQLARMAALNATAQNVAEMRRCVAATRAAETWREYEGCDNQLHRTIAEATGNTLLLAIFDTLNAVRRAVNWGRLRNNKPKPDPDHHSFAEHEAVVTAIEQRDMDAAAEAMQRHLQSVEQGQLYRSSARANG